MHNLQAASLERDLGGVRRAVVKVGSAIIAGTGGLRPKIPSILARDVRALQDHGCEVVMVVSGAVAADDCLSQRHPGGVVTSLGRSRAASSSISRGQRVSQKETGRITREAVGRLFICLDTTSAPPQAAGFCHACEAISTERHRWRTFCNTSSSWA